MIYDSIFGIEKIIPTYAAVDRNVSLKLNLRDGNRVHPVTLTSQK